MEKIDLAAWWMITNGTGTEACSKCITDILCTWHEARLENLLSLIESHTNEKLKKEKAYIARVLTKHVARYGDGIVVIHNGEALVPISKVLSELTGVESTIDKDTKE